MIIIIIFYDNCKTVIVYDNKPLSDIELTYQFNKGKLADSFPII